VQGGSYCRDLFLLYTTVAACHTSGRWRVHISAKHAQTHMTDNISQGSAATHLRYHEIFNDLFDEFPAV